MNEINSNSVTPAPQENKDREEGTTFFTGTRPAFRFTAVLLIPPRFLAKSPTSHLHVEAPCDPDALGNDDLPGGLLIMRRSFCYNLTGIPLSLKYSLTSLISSSL